MFFNIIWGSLYDKYNIKYDYICICKYIYLWLGVFDFYIDIDCYIVVLFFYWSIYILCVFIVFDLCFIILVC